MQVKNESNTRLKILLAELGIKQKDLSARTGIPTSTVNSYCTGKRRMDFDAVYKIHKAFPDVNSDWLMTGKGEMFTKTSLVMEPTPPYQTLEEEIAALTQKNRESRDAVIRELLQKISTLTDENRELMDIINKLSKLK